MVFTFLANNFLRLRFACHRHHLHQQPVSPLPDQGHHLLMAHFYYIYPVYLRQHTHKDRMRYNDISATILQFFKQLPNDVTFRWNTSQLSFIFQEGSNSLKKQQQKTLQLCSCIPPPRSQVVVYICVCPKCKHFLFDPNTHLYTIVIISMIFVRLQRPW